MRRLSSLLLLAIVLSNACSAPRNNNSGTASNSDISKAQDFPAAREKDTKQQAIFRELFRTQGAAKLLYDPQKHDYLLVRDVRKEIEELSRRFPPSEQERRLFDKRRNELVNQTNRRLVNRPDNLAHQSNSTPPVPGGIGVGIFFRDTELIFSQSSAIYFYIIVPSALGGNTVDFFYLTSTNRAGRGCEALVSYSRQDKPLFRVFDWAKVADHQDAWVVGIPYDEWGAYKLRYTVDSHDYEAIYAVNVTYALDDKVWVNEVYLHNGQLGTHDLVWSYNFQWSPRDQKEKNDHWWGPILETFAPDYGETNPVGFADALLVQDGWERVLVDANSYTGNDGSDHGFQVFRLDHNYTFLAH